MGGFRNILIHGYLDIDAARVPQFLIADSGVFRRFIEAIEAWLANLQQAR